MAKSAAAATKVSVPLERLDPTLKSHAVQKFENDLAAKIIGQPEAVSSFVGAYQIYVSGLHPTGRPVAVLLLAGPTGTGKTRVCEASAEILLGSPQAVTKINCAEYHLSHETARLIGPPPGFVGFRETQPALSQENIDHFQTDRCKLSFVLFDEIEKANETLWQLLLGILDKGQLTLGDSRKTDFSLSIIAMTSNLGAREVDRLMTGASIGFTKPEIKGNIIASTVDAQIKKRFTPEFVNRIDRTVVFNRLEREHYERILQLELDLIQGRVFLASSTKDAPVFALRWLPSVRNLLLDRGTDTKYGARELKRVIERDIVLPLSNLVSSNSITEGDIIVVGVEKGNISFHRETTRAPSE